MLLLGLMIGLWIGVPVGILLIAMLGPRERQAGGANGDPRAMQDMLARRFPWGPPAEDASARPALPPTRSRRVH